MPFGLTTLAAAGPADGVFLPVFALVWWIPYRARVRKLANERRAVPQWRQACFASGLIVLAIALSPPVDTLADQLLVAHMAEHLLIGDFAALLLVLGFTGPLLAPILRNRYLGRLRVFTHPVVAFVVWAVNFYVWHLPFMYQAALRHDALHALEHATFLAFGMAMWMALLGPAAQARLVHQRRAAGLHHRGPPDRDGAGQRDDLLGHCLVPDLPLGRRPLAHQRRSPTRSAPPG